MRFTRLKERLLDQKTSEIYPNNSISLSIWISTPEPGILNLNLNFNSSWRIELLMAHPNNSIFHQYFIPGLGDFRRFLLGISSRYLGGLLVLYQTLGLHQSEIAYVPLGLVTDYI